MLLYALISEQIGQAIAFYAAREGAEAELRDARSDEPEWTAVLRVEASEFEAGANQ